MGSVHRIQIDTRYVLYYSKKDRVNLFVLILPTNSSCSTGEPASGATWEEVESLIDARADHACEVIQYVHDKNTVIN